MLTFCICRETKFSKMNFSLIALLFCFVCKTASADMEQAYKAFKAQDYARALTEARQVIDLNTHSIIPSSPAKHSQADKISHAYFLLGFLFEHGLGVQVDFEQALQWYQKAANRGYIEGELKVDLAKYLGRGEAPNKDLSYFQIDLSGSYKEAVFSIFMPSPYNSDPNLNDEASKVDQLNLPYFAYLFLLGNRLSVESDEYLVPLNISSEDKKTVLDFADHLANASALPSLASQYLLYAILAMEILNNQEIVERVVSSQDYQRVAARPPDRRTTDAKVYDVIYTAATRGNPVNADLFLLFAGLSGNENRKKMRFFLQKAEKNKEEPHILARFSPRGSNRDDTRLKTYYAAVLKRMDQLGESYASPLLFSLMEPYQMFVARVEACGRDQENDQEMPKIMSTKVTKPLSNASYLPSEVEGYQQAYLITGQWQEEWKYVVCGKTVVVHTQFDADGLGSASFKSTAKISVRP